MMASRPAMQTCLADSYIFMDNQTVLKNFVGA
jgi:hypothetical protein